MTSSQWDTSLSQTAYMQADTVLVLSPTDTVIGSASKHTSHQFNPDAPRGILHRAFSVFLFDASTNEMLLQKRASTKITFPNVWTNTCCSHPLHGMEPAEVDGAEDVKDGSVRGVKYAAIRKLEQELGIPIDTFEVDQFKFLTRLHYWAADTVTHGKDSPWGEHEIDYVLFVTVPSKSSITLAPHPEEVDDVAWVSQSQLLSMFNDKTLLFSPWFRIIVHKWMIGGWWNDVKAVMETNKYCDYENIHKFDPPVEHMGGSGGAGALFEKEKVEMNGNQHENGNGANGDANKKQGAYGKVTTHKESKLTQLIHMDEVFSAISLLYIHPLKSNLNHDFITSKFNPDDLAFCDEILCKVSRSFAAVIRQLPPTLLVDVLIFYLVLRALDTVEDDMTYFTSNETKVKVLQSFHKTALLDPKWKMMGCGEGDERRLLEEFPKCHSVYAALPDGSRRVISDITQRMATGMAEFVDKDLGQGTTDVTQYNRYCHFVAGLVGEGLSRLFSVSELEEPSLATELYLSDQMGLFLQKTNIIRDYLEDYVDGRAFWPQSVWKKYSLSGDLGYFAKPTALDATNAGLHCLNELVTDALELVPDCLAYLSKLRCSEVFRFCAIPQVMAIATLDKCYHNRNVFTGVVKIRKGMSCLLINNTTDFLGVHGIFHKFASSIMKKAQSVRKGGFNDPSFERTMKACSTIIELTETETKKGFTQKSLVNSAMVAVSCAAGYLTSNSCPGVSKLSLYTTGFLASFGMYTMLQMMGWPQKFAMSGSAASSLLPASELRKDE